MYLLLLCICGVAYAAPLRIRVTDETGRPIWVRLEVYGPDGRRHQPADAVLDARSVSVKEEPGYRSSFVMNGECHMDLPPGRYRVIAEHGLEYERLERAVDLSPTAEPLQIQLRPWVRARELGWWSGDMHVHRPPEQMEALALAEDLNLSVVFTMWNKRNLWADRPIPRDPVMRISPNHLAMLMNAEDERGGGAWMLHQIPEPLPLAVDGRWFPPGIQFVRQARARRPAGGLFPWFDLEKLIWWEVPVILALEPADSLGVLHNHFNQYGMLDHEAWGRPRDRSRFPGFAGLAEYTTGLYYRYLNLGFRLPPSAGSASGVLPNPPGYNRVYAQFTAPLTVEKWYTALRQGRSFVTNGPLLFFTAKPSGNIVKVSLDVRAREPIERIELVANGQVIKRVTPQPGSKQWKGRLDLEAKNYSWIAARCFLENSQTVRMAHSSPVYLDGQWDARSDAQYFVAWIDALLAESSSDPQRFATPAERDEVLALYRSARQSYADRAKSATQKSALP